MPFQAAPPITKHEAPKTFVGAESVNLASTDATPSRSGVWRGLYVGGTGAVAVDLLDGTTNVIFSAVPAGTFLPVAVTRVYKTGTAATLILGLY